MIDQNIVQLRRQLRNIINYAKSIHVEEALIVSNQQRQDLIDVWHSVCEVIITLESISSGYNPQLKSDYWNYCSAFYACYAGALEFINWLESHKKFVPLISFQKRSNHNNEQLGVADYDSFKLHFLNIKIATRFAALQLVRPLFSKPITSNYKKISQDQHIIWHFSQKKGPKLTIKNAKTLLKRGGFSVWFPMQKGTANLMGKIKLQRRGKTLISQEQIKSLSARLEPGDIFLQRREWFLTNIGIPGFWPHGALYIGDKAQRKSYFDDSEVISWVKSLGVQNGNFESLLEKCCSKEIPDDSFKIIEAIAPGVVFTKPEKSLAADSLATLRPNLSKLDKAKAIKQAFEFVGLAYDYNFNFLTDHALVCSEVIYKSFQHCLSLPTKKIAGKPLMPANLLAQCFADEFLAENPQFQLIQFLDGNEQLGIAQIKTAEEFVASVNRPKWHILKQS